MEVARALRERYFGPTCEVLQIVVTVDGQTTLPVTDKEIGLS